MNGNSHTMFRAIRGPVTLITIGVLFALNNFTLRLRQTWPVILIVFGLLSLLRRGTQPIGNMPPPRPYSYPPPGGYSRSPYAGGPATTPGGSTAIGSTRRRPSRRRPMRRRSFTGPLLLLLIGACFCGGISSGSAGFRSTGSYWPFLLIAWGLLRLIEALVWSREGCGYGFTGGEVVLVVLICIAGSGMWAAHHHGVRWNLFGPDVSAAVRLSGFGTRPSRGHEPHRFRESSRQHQGDWRDTQEVTVNGHKLIRAYARTDADRTNQSTPARNRTARRPPAGAHQPGSRVRQPAVSDDIEVTVPRGMAVEARGRVAITRSRDMTAMSSWQPTAAMCGWRGWAATRASRWAAAT